MKNLPLLPIFLILLCFFTALVFLGLDPDLGWRLQVAKDYVETGTFPYADRYSFALPNFQWVDFEFRMELIMYFIYKSFGYFGLGMFFSVVTSIFITTHLYLTHRLLKVNYLVIGIFSGLLLFGIISGFGIRTPVVSVWANVILFWLIFWYLRGFSSLKIKLVLSISTILLFWIWANLHPGFFLGWGILAGAIFYKSIKERHFNPLDLFTAVVSLVVTLFNLYGIRLWLEIISYFVSPQASYFRGHIQEWRSPFFIFPPSYISVLSLMLITVFVAFRFKIFRTGWLFFYCVLCLYVVSAALAVRNLPLLVIWALPLGLVAFQNDFKRSISLSFWLKQFSICFLTALFGLTLLNICLKNYPSTFLGQATKHGNTFPSTVAVAKAREAVNGKSNIYNPYNWGGFLIARWGGEPKIFLDGRMPATWYQGSVFPFKDYMDANTNEKKKAFFEKYKFELALVEKTNWRELDGIQTFLVGGQAVVDTLRRYTEEPSIRKWLESQPSWAKIYGDETAEVFVKVN